MAPRLRTYSRATLEALRLLGGQIKLARKRRGLTEADLAARMGIARSTLQLIERSDPKVEIGLALEAATLVGVPPFESGGASLAPHIARVEETLALLPRAVQQRGEVRDDF